MLVSIARNTSSVVAAGSFTRCGRLVVSVAAVVVPKEGGVPKLIAAGTPYSGGRYYLIRPAYLGSTVISRPGRFGRNGRWVTV